MVRRPRRRLPFRLDLARRLAVAVVESIDECFGRPLPTPGPLRVTLIREDEMALIFKLTLPPPGAADVVSRELTEVVNGGAPNVLTVTDGHELRYEHGDAVVLTLVDVDDAGNRSEPSPAFEFSAADTIAPSPPGELSVALLREDFGEATPPVIAPLTP